MPETNLNIGAALPGEALAIRILDFIDSRRSEMDPELRKRYDTIGVEMCEFWYGRMKALGALLDPKK